MYYCVSWNRSEGAPCASEIKGLPEVKGWLSENQNLGARPCRVTVVTAFYSPEDVFRIREVFGRVLSERGAQGIEYDFDADSSERLEVVIRRFNAIFHEFERHACVTDTCALELEPVAH